MGSRSKQELVREIEDLQKQLFEAKETLRTIRDGELEARAPALPELEQAHDRMRWLSRFPEENPNPVARVSAEGNVVYRNAAAADLPGWTWGVGEALPASLRRLFQEAMAETRELRQDMQLGDRFYSVSLVPFPAEGYLNVYGIDITERKRAEEEILNRAAQLEATIGAMSDAVLIYDTGMNVQRVNSAFVARYGFDPVGLNLREIIRRVSCRLLDGRPLILEDQPTPRALRGEKVTGASFLVTLPDGSDAVVETSSRPMQVGDHIIGSVTVWHDITEAKFAEEALRESELFLKETQKIARLGGWMANPFTDYLKWTDGVYEIIEAPRDYAPGLEKGLKFFLPQYIPVLKERLENCLTTGEPFTLECQVRTTEGKTLWTEVRGLAPVVKGERTYVVGTFQDITERKRAEQAVRDSESRFRLLSETAGRLLAAEDPQEIVDDLCRAVMEHLDCQTCFHFLVDEATGKLHLSACTGISPEESCKIAQLDYGMAISGGVARDRVQIVIEDLLNLPDPRAELIRSYGIQAYSCHPLIAGGRILGTLSFGTRTRTHFSPQDLAVMKTVADQVATAMERKRLLSELNKSREELEIRVRERTGELLMANLALQEQANLLELAHDAILVRDLHDRIVYWNRGAEKTYGWTQDEARGKVADELLQTRFPESLEEIGSVLREAGEWEGELHHITRDGRPMVVESRQALQRNLAGEPTGVLEINRDITKRKEAEERLHHLAAIVESSDDAIIGKTLEGRILSWNKAAERIYGYALEEVVGQPISMLVPHDRSNELPDLLEKLKNGESIAHFETVRIRKDGTTIPVSLAVSPVKDTKGRIVGASTITRDISELKRTEEQLRQAFQYSRSLIEASLDPLVTISPEGKITDINEATIRVTGVPRKKLIGSDFSKYFTEPEKATEGYRQVFERGFVTDYPLTIRHPDGSLVEVLYNASVYKDSRGKVLGVFAAARDITERKRAEEQVNQAKILLQSVFDGISEPLLMVEKDLRVKVLNQAALRYFQVTGTDEATGKTCYDLTDGRCQHCDQCMLHQAIAKGKTVSFERRGLFDHDRIEQVTVYPLKEADGGIAGAIIRIGDLTETRKLEQHMTRVDRLSSLGQLSAGIAHEIRNPLAGINLFVDVLTDAQKFQRTGQELEILGEVKNNIKKIDGIIKRVLDFSRQSESPTREKVDVSLVLDDTIKLWRSALTKSGIVLQLKVAEGLPELRGDAIEFQQVFNNLLQNAVDAMAQGGTLTIRACKGLFSLDKNRQAVIISFLDTGPGIPVEHRGSIFNPFYTTKPAGTGLGLAICHRIVSRHGGAIFCESTSNAGTTFQIEFPILSGD